jgi:proton-coupled amino acid transporter
VYDSLSPRRQATFPRTLSLTLAGVCVAYCVTGLLPYLYFVGVAGVRLDDIVLLNLPREWWAWAVLAGYCLALAFSYPLMMFPAIRIIEAALTRAAVLPRGPGSRWRRNGVRALVVAATLGVSLAGSTQLNNFVALVGCFCCTPLAFIYPPLFHLRLVKDAHWATRAGDVAIIAFGVGVFVFSTYQSIAQWTDSPVNPCVAAAAAPAPAAVAGGPFALDSTGWR